MRLPDKQSASRMESRVDELEERITSTLAALAAGELNESDAAWRILGMSPAQVGVRPDLKIFNRRAFPRPEQGESPDLPAQHTAPQGLADNPTGTPLASGAAKERTQREVEALALLLERAGHLNQLDHPSLVLACRYSAGFAEAVQMNDGETLSAKLRDIYYHEELFDQHDASLHERLKLVGHLHTLANILKEIHAQGLVHRHLRPQCILITAAGDVRLGGWGSALMEAREGDTTSDESALGFETMGQTTAMPMTSRTREATPYLAPELARGENLTLDPRTDVYGLGALLYHILCEHPPYEFSVAVLILRQILHEPPEPIAERVPDAPREILQLTDSAMRRERERRLASASAFLRRLELVLPKLPSAEGDAPTAAPMALWKLLLAGFLLAVLGGSGVLWVMDALEML